MTALVGTALQAPHQLDPVDRLDDVGVRRHGSGLVALEATDVVPGEAEVGALRGLGDRLLVTVLADVEDPEVGQDAHVGGREELGDHDQGDLVGVAAGLAAGPRDPLPDRGQPGPDVVGAAHRPLLIQTTPANRVEASPSRR